MQCPNFASISLLLVFPITHSSSFHCWCTRPCTDTNNRQHRSSFHIQTGISHIGTMLLSALDQSGQHYMSLISWSLWHKRYWIKFFRIQEKDSDITKHVSLIFNIIFKNLIQQLKMHKETSKILNHVFFHL